MTEPAAGHTSPQKPPDVSKRHPATTPVPMFVPEQNPPNMQVSKTAQAYSATRAAFDAVKTLEGWPQVRNALQGDLHFAKETRWVFDEDRLIELAGEIEFLSTLLADPGVQRIAGLLRGGREAA